MAKPFKMSVEGQAEHSFLAYMLPAASAPALDTAATPSGCDFIITLSSRRCCGRGAVQGAVNGGPAGLRHPKQGRGSPSRCMPPISYTKFDNRCHMQYAKHILPKHVCLHYREETELQWIREYDYAMRTAQNDQVSCVEGAMPWQCKNHPSRQMCGRTRRLCWLCSQLDVLWHLQHLHMLLVCLHRTLCFCLAGTAASPTWT